MNVCSLLCVGSIALVIARVLWTYERNCRLPKGPQGKWVIGNLRDVTSAYQWRTFSEWTSIFGDIIYLNVFGRHIVVLNSLADALELMDKNGAIYSDRPQLVYIHDLLKIRSVTFMPYGPLWRMNRRLLHQYLNTRAMKDYQSHQSRCVQELLRDLLASGDFWEKISKYSTSLILSATYGYERSHDNGELVELNVYADRVIFGPGPPGATSVDVFPTLRFIPSWLPGGSLKKLALENREALWEVATRPYELVKEKWAAGTAKSCLLTRILDDCQQTKQDDSLHYETIKDVCASMYRAGVGTSSAIIYVFILAMLLHPKVAKKAQDELDAALGDQRLPKHEDKEALPYISCILKECMRWRPPAPLGMAHRATEAGYLKEWYIPKGSVILPNVWHMMHDERTYSNPEAFDPERYAGDTPAMDPGAAIFGFGRRLCPGRHFAESGLWLVLASILATFDISPALDENGQGKLPDPEDFSPNLVSSPRRFGCKFTPRSQKITMLIGTIQSSLKTQAARYAWNI